MASDGGEIWLSAVMRCSLEPPIGPMTIGVDAPDSPRFWPIAAIAACDSPSTRRGSSGIVTNTLPSA